MKKKTKTVRFYKFVSISEQILEGTKIDTKVYHTDESKVIIQGPNGVIVSHSLEGVHSTYDNIDEVIPLKVWKKPVKTKDGALRYQCFAEFEVKAPIREFLSMNPEYEEIELKDAVRIFGDRLDNNYSLLLRSCEEIGLKLDEYNIKRREEK